MLGRVVLLLFSATLVSACGRGDRPHVPDGPSTAIALATDVPVALTTVRCTGPAAEVALLGALCDDGAGSVSGYWRVGVPTSGALQLRRDGREPYLLVFAYPPAGSPDDGPWSAVATRHAAFVVLDGPDSDVVAQLEAWQHGEAATGELVTTSIAPRACSTSWSGGGTLLWRGVTIELAWDASIPC